MLKFICSMNMTMHLVHRFVNVCVINLEMSDLQFHPIYHDDHGDSKYIQLNLFVFLQRFTTELHTKKIHTTDYYSQQHR